MNRHDDTTLEFKKHPGIVASFSFFTYIRYGYDLAYARSIMRSGGNFVMLDCCHEDPDNRVANYWRECKTTKSHRKLLAHAEVAAGSYCYLFVIYPLRSVFLFTRIFRTKQGGVVELMTLQLRPESECVWDARDLRY